MTRLSDLTAAEVGSQGNLLLLPLGSCEQHGAHLPLDTDTRISAAVAEAMGRERPGILVAPALAYGASGEHAGFPGTVSLGTEALTGALVEAARSLGPEFDGLAILSWHGGNARAVAAAVAIIRSEGRRAVSIFPALEGDAHAGRTETSLMLAIAPESVRLERAAAGNRRPVAELMPEMRAGGVKAVSPSGVLGDPAGASAEEGRRLLATLVDRALERLDHWQQEMAR